MADRDQHVATISDHLSSRREELDECFTGSPDAVISLFIHDGLVELARSTQAPWTAEDESVAACLLRTLHTDALPNGRPLFVTAMNHRNAYSYGKVSGHAIKAMVAATHAHEGSLQECYNDALRLWPTLEGRVLSRLTYDTQGKVVDAVVLRNETEQTLLGCCAVHVMRTWTMPAVSPRRAPS